MTYSATGSHTITAKYLGDTNYSASPTSPSITQVVNAAATTTAVVSTLGNPSVVGQAVTYTATVAVTAPGSGTPTGNVEFFDGGTAISTAAGSSATRSAAPAPPVVVTYSDRGQPHHHGQYFGGTNYAPRPPRPSITQVVNQAATTTSVVSTTGSPSVVGQAVTYTATVAVTAPGSGTPTGNDRVPRRRHGHLDLWRGNAATPLSGTSATCAVTYSATGSHTITAKYLGDYQLLGLAHLDEHHPGGQRRPPPPPRSAPRSAPRWSARPSPTPPRWRSPHRGRARRRATIEFLDGGTAISTCGGATGNAAQRHQCHLRRDLQRHGQPHHHGQVPRRFQLLGLAHLDEHHPGG